MDEQLFFRLFAARTFIRNQMSPWSLVTPVAFLFSLQVSWPALSERGWAKLTDSCWTMLLVVSYCRLLSGTDDVKLEKSPLFILIGMCVFVARPLSGYNFLNSLCLQGWLACAPAFELELVFLWWARRTAASD